MSNTTSIVKAIGEISFEGNLVPQSWNHWLKVFNGGKTSGVIPIASLILSDIVYWYRPTKVDDEKSGLVEGYKAKFAADKLQRSYNAIAEQQAITKTQAKNAVKMLEDAGVITVEFRTIDVRGTKLGNVMFLEPVPAIVKLWCKYPYKTKIEKNKEKILYGDLDEKLFDEYLSLCVKLPIPVRQKTHRSEQLNAQVFAELQTGVGKIAQTNTESTTKTSTENTTEISSETSVYIKALGRADTDESQNEKDLTNEQEQQSGTVSPTSHPDSRRRETHETQNETDLYSTPWNPKTESFRVDDRGWAVMPPTNKHKLVRALTTKSIQLELLYELDDNFSAEWNEDESKLWVTTTHAGSGWEEDVLGTVVSAGANCIDYDEEDYCTPGNASLRVLRDWGYQTDKIGQIWFNERLKELWDDVTRFCKQNGSNAKFILDSRPLWECINIDIELE